VTVGFGYSNPAFPLNPDLPLRVEPYATQMLWLPAGEVAVLAKVLRDTGQVDGRISAWISIQVSGPKTYRTESFPV
jgi:hypothetical protein